VTGREFRSKLFFYYYHFLRTFKIELYTSMVYECFFLLFFHDLGVSMFFCYRLDSTIEIISHVSNTNVKNNICLPSIWTIMLLLTIRHSVLTILLGLSILCIFCLKQSTLNMPFCRPIVFIPFHFSDSL